MSYLYGDSTPSPLESNYIDFLRGVLDFSVRALQLTDRLRVHHAQAEKLRQAAAAECERLERLAALVTQAIDRRPADDPDSPTAICAKSIATTATEKVRTQTEQVRSTLAAELARLDAACAEERQGGVRALESLLLQHDLPETALVLSFLLENGSSYAAKLEAKSALGVDASIDIDVPEGHLFAQGLRLERLCERIEITAPDTGGWLSKEVKMKPQRIERLYVSELTIGVGGGNLRLRSSSSGAGNGFNLVIHTTGPRVELLRIADSDAAVASTLELSPDDAHKIIEVYEKLGEAARDLVRNRKALAKISLDEKPLSQHDNLRVLVERLVTAMSPVVQEIAWRSRSATELVLKRLLDNNRREEIFVTKTELAKQLAPLPADVQRIFDPLGLTDDPSLSNGPGTAPKEARGSSHVAPTERAQTPQTSRPPRDISNKIDAVLAEIAQTTKSLQSPSDGLGHPPAILDSRVKEAENAAGEIMIESDDASEVGPEEHRSDDVHAPPNGAALPNGAAPRDGEAHVDPVSLVVETAQPPQAPHGEIHDELHLEGAVVIEKA